MNCGAINTCLVVDSYLICELSRDVFVLWSLGVTEQLTVRRVHDGDTEFNNVLLIFLFYHVGILFYLTATKPKHIATITNVTCFLSRMMVQKTRFNLLHCLLEAESVGGSKCLRQHSSPPVIVGRTNTTYLIALKFKTHMFFLSPPVFPRKLCE